MLALESPEIPATFSVVGRRRGDLGEGTEGKLAPARIVVAAGRGIAPGGLIGIRDLADVLGGELVQTRPLAEHTGGREANRGEPCTSGIEVAPDLYVTVGRSAEREDLPIAQRAKVVVAIDDDPTATIFTQADYGVVGDPNEVVVALTSLLAGTFGPIGMADVTRD